MTLSHERVLKLPSASLCELTFKRCIVQSAFEIHIIIIGLDQCEARAVWGLGISPPSPQPRRGTDRSRSKFSGASCLNSRIGEVGGA